MLLRGHLIPLLTEPGFGCHKQHGVRLASGQTGTLSEFNFVVDSVQNTYGQNFLAQSNRGSLCV